MNANFVTEKGRLKFLYSTKSCQGWHGRCSIPQQRRLTLAASMLPNSSCGIGQWLRCWNQTSRQVQHLAAAKITLEFLILERRYLS